MSTVHPKIQPVHLERKAFVYIRQSSMRQVEENLESQDLQYQLFQRACSLGWSPDQVVVIDDDLGKSAISSATREGFQSLVAAVGLASVGIILVTDVSRLARNCADWYRLLDLASLCGTLLTDASGIYDPRFYDDRLLLGLKGTFSEAQWYSMRSQLTAAQMNKARRGQLNLRLPLGYERREDNSVVFSADQRVQEAIRMVFSQFELLGSAQKVMRFFRDHHLFLPHYKDGNIEWKRAPYQTIYNILKQPAYAGVYTYGKHHRIHLPGEQTKVTSQSVPRQNWPVLLHDIYPAYISWEQYLANQQRLTDNAQGEQWRRGAPRNGAALLQGLVFCARCGRPMHVHYTHSPAYICDYATYQFGDRRCQNLTLAHIDPLVTQIVLDAVQPVHLEAALAAVSELEKQRQQLLQAWQLRLEQARYDANLSKRRFERVDPDNRLVAAALEHDWEGKLVELQSLENEYAAALSFQLKPISSDELAAIRSLAQDLPALWLASSTAQADRKRLLRCLIRDVSLDSFSKPGLSILRIRWHSGAVTIHETQRPGYGPPPAFEVADRVRSLALSLPDDRIVSQLNSEHFPTATGLPWTIDRVRAVRRKHRIPSSCPYLSNSPLARGDGLISAKEAARRLGVSHGMISQWFKHGFLSGYKACPHSPLWVDLSNEVFARICGSAPPSPDLIPLTHFSHSSGLDDDSIRAMIQSGSFLPFRLLHGKSFQWFLLPLSKNPLGCAQ